MLNSTVLELVIGLILVYFILSTLCSGINELVVGFTKRRAQFLEAGIVKLVGNNLKNKVYVHPLVKGISFNRGKASGDKQGDPAHRVMGRERPSYISSQTFSLALASTLGSLSTLEKPDQSTGTQRAAVEKTARPDLAKAIKDGIEKVRNVEVRRALKTLLADANGDLEAWRRSVERWYDEGMERVSGWYKRRTRAFLLLFAVVIVGALNADTFLIARMLWTQPAVRQAAAAEAQQLVAAGPLTTPEAKKALQDVQELNAKVGIPLGWTTKAGDPRVPHRKAGHTGAFDRDYVEQWALKVLGLLVTALALMLGADFWFNLLNRFVNLRSSGGAKVPSSSSSKEQPATA